MITSMPFEKSSTNSHAFFLPPAPFSVWDEDTFLWSSDEKHLREDANGSKKELSRADFLMDGKTYTIVCEAGFDMYASFLANTIEMALSGVKSTPPSGLLSFYEICKDFFTKELTSRLHFSSSDLPLWMALENELSLLFSLFLTSYPILCKDPLASIDIHFEMLDDTANITLTPHCDVDIEKDVLNGTFISTLLRATMRNANIRLSEKTSNGAQSICLSTDCVAADMTKSIFNANTATQISYLFTTILAFCTQSKKTA